MRLRLWVLAKLRSKSEKPKTQKPRATPRLLGLVEQWLSRNPLAFELGALIFGLLRQESGLRNLNHTIDGRFFEKLSRGLGVFKVGALVPQNAAIHAGFSTVIHASALPGSVSLARDGHNFIPIILATGAERDGNGMERGDRPCRRLDRPKPA